MEGRRYPKKGDALYLRNTIIIVDEIELLTMTDYLMNDSIIIKIDMF